MLDQKYIFMLHFTPYEIYVHPFWRRAVFAFGVYKRPCDCTSAPNRPTRLVKLLQQYYYIILYQGFWRTRCVCMPKIISNTLNKNRSSCSFIRYSLLYIIVSEIIKYFKVIKILIFSLEHHVLRLLLDAKEIIFECTDKFNKQYFYIENK